MYNAGTKPKWVIAGTISASLLLIVVAVLFVPGLVTKKAATNQQPISVQSGDTPLTLEIDTPGSEEVESRQTDEESKPASARQTTRPTQQPSSADIHKPAPTSKENQATIKRIEAEIAAQEERARQSKCVSIQSSYDAEMLAENGRHTKALEDIDLRHRRNGTYHWGVRLADIENENARNAGNLSAIQTKYANDEQQHGC